MTTPMARSDFFAVPGLILGLFDRPHWPKQLKQPTLVRRFQTA